MCADDSQVRSARQVYGHRVTSAMTSSGDLAEELGMILSLEAVKSACSGSEIDHMLCSGMTYVPRTGKLVVKDAGIEDGQDLSSELEKVLGLVRSDNPKRTAYRPYDHVCTPGWLVARVLSKEGSAGPLSLPGLVDLPCTRVAGRHHRPRDQNRR